MQRERDVVEHAVRTVAAQAVKADELVDEAKAAGGSDHVSASGATGGLLPCPAITVTPTVWLTGDLQPDEPPGQALVEDALDTDPTAHASAPTAAMTYGLSTV